MRKSDNPGRFRNIKLFAAVSSVIVLAGLLLLFVLGIFGYRSELVSVAATDSTAGNRYSGIGVNLDFLPNVNLIRDASFETGNEYIDVTVEDVSGSSVYFNSEDDINWSGLEGQSIRILSVDDTGTMSDRFSGTIEGYDSASLAKIEDISDSSGSWIASDIKDVCEFQSSLCVLTSDGTVYADILSDNMQTLYGEEENKIVSLFCDDTSLYALSDTGRLYVSADGRNFSYVTKNDGLNPVSAAAYESTILATDSEGKLYVCSGEESFTANLPSDTSVASVGRAGENLVAVAKDGVYQTSGGFVFSKISDIGLGSDEICDTAISDSKFYCLKSDGTILIAGTGGVQETDVLCGTGYVFTSVASGPEGILVLTTSDRVALAFYEETETYEIVSSADNNVDSVFDSADNSVIYSSDRGLYEAQILSFFTLSENISSDTVKAGDMCEVTVKSAGEKLSVNEEDTWAKGQSWDIYGEGTSATVSDGKMCLSGSSSGVHVLSQALPGTSSDNFTSDTFYRISLDVKSNASLNTTVWLEGDTFGTVAFSSENIGEGGKTLSYVFAVTPDMLGDDTVRLYISFEGTGELYIDDVYAGPDSYDGPAVPEGLVNIISKASPETVRLGGIAIGGEGFCSDTFYSLNTSVVSVGDEEYLSSVNSLEQCLKFIDACDADPWFVLGSSVTQEDVDNLLSYLCGGVSEGYGQVRVENGHALPWSRSFDTIYFEIDDTENCYGEDYTKAAYANYVISLITSSEYFSAIKDKTVFLDAMDYASGSMLSDCDAHVSSLDLGTESYTDLAAKSPRNTSSSGLGEYINSLTLGDNISCADFICLILSDDASFTELSLIDCNIAQVPANYYDYSMFDGDESIKSAFKIMELFASVTEKQSLIEYDTLISDPLDDSYGQSTADFSEKCGVFLFGDSDTKYLLVANKSSEIVQFVLSGNGKSLTGSQFVRYSSSGESLSDGSLSSLFLRRTLGAGEFTIVEIDS